MKRILSVLFFLTVHSCLAQLVATQPRGINAASLAAISDGSAEGASPACGGADGQMSCTSTLGSVPSQILYYNFSECAASGTTTITDWSGNGNSVSLASNSNPPTCSAKGLYFSPATQGSYFRLPSAAANGQTFSFELCAVPDQGYASHGYINADFLTSDNSSGIVLSLGNYAAPYNSLSWAPLMGSSNASQYMKIASAISPDGSCHVFTYVYDASTLANNHVYIDGTEPSYIARGALPGNIALGNLYIGKPWVGCATNYCGLWGYLRSMRIYSSQLTPAQVMTMANFDLANGILFGVPQWKPNNSTVETVAVSGDSRSNPTANPGDNTWPNLLSLGRTYNLYNNAVAGYLLDQLKIFDPPNTLSEYASGASRNTVYIWACVNDVLFGGGSAALCSSDLAAAAKADKANGYKVIVFEELSATDNYDNTKDALNTYIRANWKNFADGVVTCSDPNLCADGAYASTTYFLDGVHPSQTGQNLLATYASNAYLMLYGSTAANPNTTSAVAYQMTAADSNLVANNASNAVSLALPNCLGFESSVWSITAGSGSNAVTLAPVSGQTIDGSTSAISLVAGQNKKLTLTPGALSTGGCSWVSLN